MGAKPGRRRKRGAHRAPTNTFGRRIAALVSVAALAVSMAITGVASAGTGPLGDRGSGYEVSGGWIGSYSYGSLSDVFCLDSGHASPGAGGGSVSLTNTFAWPEANYILTRWGTNPSNEQAAAMKFVFDRLLSTSGTKLTRDPKPGHADDYASLYNADEHNVKTNAETMLTAAASFAGPYTLAGSVTQAPTGTNGTVKATFTLRSAAGQPMTGKKVTFTATGSANAVSPATATTNGNGQVSVTYSLNNSASGGVRAVAEPGYGTDVLATGGRWWWERGTLPRVGGVHWTQRAASRRASVSTSSVPPSAMSCTASFPPGSNGVRNHMAAVHGSTTAGSSTASTACNAAGTARVARSNCHTG